jgi:hypothetical protein
MPPERTPMLALTMMLALISETPTAPVLPPVGVDLVPGPPALPEGLPARIAVESPVAGTLLPYPRDVAVGRLIGYCVEDYPRVVRTALERTREVEAIACNGRLAVQRVQYLGQEAVEDPGWPTWKVSVIVAGGVALGLLVGFGAGSVLGR